MASYDTAGHQEIHPYYGAGLDQQSDDVAHHHSSKNTAFYCIHNPWLVSPYFNQSRRKTRVSVCPFAQASLTRE